MRRDGGISAKELAARVPLAELVGEVVKLRRTGRQHVGLCPFHAEKTPSFNVYGDGKYMCFGCRANGDALDFLQEYYGLTFAQAADHLKARLGITERGTLAPLKARPAPVVHEDERDRKDGVMLWCVERWSETMVTAAGPVEEYLLGRGIDTDLLGGLPECLRFHPKMWHGEAGRHLWAMVARIEDAHGLMCGIHRTFLEAKDAMLCEEQPLAVQKLRGAWPQRVVTKADVPGAKKMNGTAKGGCVRLAPAGRVLGIAEGIETALAVMQETDMPVWAALSLGNLGNLTIPPHVHELVLFADNDMKDKAAAEKIIQAAAAGYQRTVPAVRIARPPEGMDFNDLLLQELLGETCFPENHANLQGVDGNNAAKEARMSQAKDKPLMFGGYECKLEFGRYGNDRIAIQLVDARDGEPVATATVNMPDKHLRPDQVLIKDYSENEGMLQALEDAGVVRRTGVVSTGYAQAYVCDLLVKEAEKAHEEELPFAEPMGDHDIEMEM